MTLNYLCWRLRHCIYDGASGAVFMTMHFDPAVILECNGHRRSMAKQHL